MTPQEKILHSIPLGKQHARTAKEIERATGIDSRTVREMIAELRRSGNAIASSIRPPYGYYMLATVEEQTETLRHLYSRVKQILMVANALKKSFGQ